MSIMTSVKLAAQIKSIGSNTTKLREQVQEALVSCAYYAAKDGDVGPFNRLLDATNGAVRLKGITMWGELIAQVVRIKDEKFILNKKVRNEMNVTDEASFAPFEAEMRKVAWWEVAGKEKIQSVFDPVTYLGSVTEKLKKEGFADMAAAIADLTEAAKKNDALKTLAERLESEVGAALV
jgi:hypothetical protein